jgi:hypothetical protein
MRLRAFFAVGAVLLAACGGSSGDELNESPAPASSNGAKGSAIGASCQPVVAAACKPGFHVSSAAEVIAASKAELASASRPCALCVAPVMHSTAQSSGRSCREAWMAFARSSSGSAAT